MMITNRQIFESLVCVTLSGKLRFTEYLEEKYGVDYKYFWDRNTNEIPINDFCAEMIMNMCSGILSTKNDNSYKDEEEKDIKNIISCKRHYRRLVSALENDFYILNPTDDQICIIIEVIVTAIENVTEIDFVELLWKIKTAIYNKTNSKIKFSNDGARILKRYESKLNPWLIDESLPDFCSFIDRKVELSRITKKIKEKNWTAIVGEPGCGKYTLALQYAKENKSDYDYIYCLSWQGSLIDTLAQIPTSDDEFYTCRTDDNNRVYESNKERAERKRKIILSSTESILIIMYDVWSVLPKNIIEEICESNSHDIQFLITTNHNYKNSITISKPTKQDYRNIFSGFYPGIALQPVNKYINKIYEISEGNLQRFTILLKYWRIHCNNDYIDNLYGLYSESMYGVFFRDTDLFSVDYHGETYTGTLLEHMKRSFLLHLISDEEKEQLYYSVLLLDERTEYHYLRDLFGYKDKWYDKLNKYELLKYGSSKTTFCYSKMLQMIMFCDYLKLDYRLCNYLYGHFDNIHSSVIDKCNYFKMLFRCLDYQWYSLKAEDELKSHICMSYWCYAWIFESFSTQCLLHHKILKSFSNEVTVLNRPEWLYNLNESVLKSIQKYMNEYFQKCSEYCSQNPGLSAKMQQVFSVTYLYDLWFQPPDTTENQKLMDTLNNIIEGEIPDQDKLYFKICIYYRSNNVEGMIDTLDKAFGVQEVNQPENFLYRLLLSLLCFEEKTDLLTIVYDKCLKYKNKNYAGYVALTMLEIILGKEYDIHPLIQTENYCIYALTLIVILLEKYVPNSQDEDAILNFCFHNNIFSNYWKRFKNFEYGLNTTELIEFLNDWKSCIWAILGYKSEDIDKYITTISSTDNPEHINSTLDSVIPKKLIEAVCSTFHDSKNS